MQKGQQIRDYVLDQKIGEGGMGEVWSATHQVLHRPVAWLERRYGRPLRVAARQGVILSAGGFVFNGDMLREHAPAYRGGLRLGTAGDDGSGIRLGTEVGAGTGGAFSPGKGQSANSFSSFSIIAVRSKSPEAATTN